MSIRTNTKYKIMKLGNNNTKRKCDNTKKKNTVGITSKT